MRCAIMQPTYIPWAGFFNLMSNVDVFIFLDDAQFERGTWHHRNRLLVGGSAHWLTIPVIRTHIGQSIDESRIDGNPNWRRKHFELLRQNFAHHPFSAPMLSRTEAILDTEIENLADLNIKLISEFASALGIKTPCKRASETGITSKRTERLIEMCEYFQCDEYLSPIGAAEYLEADGFRHRSPARLIFQDYIPKPYPQLGSSEFVSHLSVVDVVANIGIQRSAEYILETNTIGYSEVELGSR